MKLGPILRTFLIAFALLLQFTFAHAFDETALLATEREAISMRSDLERVQTVLDQEGVTDEQLSDQRSKVEQLRLDTVAEALKLTAPLNDVQQQLNQLGPVPAAGQVEPATIALQRKSLTDGVARFVAAQKNYELIGVEAEQLSAKVSAKQRSQFFQRIFKADKSILNPQLWRDASVGIGLLFARISSLLSIWWVNQAPVANWLGLLLLPTASIFGWSIWKILGNGFFRWLPKDDPEVLAVSPLRRLWRVLGGTLGTALLALVLSFLFTLSLISANLMTPRFQVVIITFVEILTSTIISARLAYLICAPQKPFARLIAVDEKAARTIPIFVLLASFIEWLASGVSSLSDQLLLPVSLVAGQSAIAAASLIGLAGILLIILRRQANVPPTNVPEPRYLSWFVKFMPLIWLLLGIALLGLVFGYVALAYFIAGKILDTVLVVVVLVLIHHLIDALSDSLQNPASHLGELFRRWTAMGERGIGRLVLSFRTLADVLLVLLGIPILFGLWTVTWVDFRSIFNSTVVGFRIGNVNISPINIASLVLILILGILLTRFITGWLNRRVLTQTRLNKGVQDSVRTSANYAGYILAGAFALSAAGFDFSSITIVAGALGVGIGFGLQSIVNNFVSGLILLAERPIRVGDWVVTSDGEGIVKKINVRATEIETFDNCTIIVPNSNLITGAVRNWTHQDTLGRFLVTVGVAHGSNAEAVSKLLTTIVANHPKVLRYPVPLVQLAKFSQMAMDFEVRGHVADVFEAAQVTSDLRLSISKEFGEKGFIIPSFPDLGLRK
jgi:potassium-dependent mechanosensitive channel